MGIAAGLSSVLAICAGLAFAGLVFLVWSTRQGTQTRSQARALLAEVEGEIVFVFDDTDLVDASPLGRAFLSKGDPRQTDFERLASLLTPRFPDFRARCLGLVSEGSLTLTPSDGGEGEIEMEHWYGHARIRLNPRVDAKLNDSVILAEAMSGELDVLRALSDNAPILIWRHEADGTLGWANRAYVEVADQIAGNSKGAWPPPALFDGIARPAGRAPVVEQSWLRTNGHIPPRCYEVTSVLRDSGVLHFAVDITEIQRAEQTRQQFIQTLSKTFAQLSVGLAVFDRSRRLVTFNPALMDMLQLPTDFLIARPSMPTFLDRLRESRMVPEPKDYGSWREEIEALETDASNGQYEQIWDLPNGLAFRVSGRPHPDGAIAFLFEDVSDELALTRRFRSHLELNQEVLDTIPEALVVFSASGVMQLTNRAYRQMWNTEGHLSLHDSGPSEEAAMWCAASDLPLAEAETWLSHGPEQVEFTTPTSQRYAGVRIRLPQGNMMFRFREVHHERPRLTLTAGAQAG